MSKENKFEFEDESTVFDDEALKEMIVSEIDTIRDGLTVLNLYLGEPLQTLVEFLKVMGHNGPEKK